VIKMNPFWYGVLIGIMVGALAAKHTEIQFWSRFGFWPRVARKELYQLIVTCSLQELKEAANDLNKYRIGEFLRATDSAKRFGFEIIEIAFEIETETKA